MLGPEHAGLAVEAVDGAPHVRLALEHAGVVDQVAGGEVVGAVDHQVVVPDQLAGVLRRQPGLVQGDLHVRVDLGDLVAGALQLGAADVGGAVDDLPLQVGGVDDVEVDQAEVPTPAAARYMALGAPRPPAPMSRTRAFLSRFCPSMATSGMIRWRE